MPPGIELEVCELTKRYSPQVSVGPISFEVQQGEFFSLLGPSGCGKTTTLRCIAGFEALTEGSISLHGERLDDKPPHRRDVGLVFQNYALFPHLTVFDNVAFGLRLRWLGKAEIVDRVGGVLQLVDLAGMAARFPAQLSGGQQQRVAIACSLVLEPRILMFDEPLSNLDFKLRIQMREELRNLQRRLSKTSIYVTHDQTETLALSDRIAVMSHGRIEQSARLPKYTSGRPPPSSQSLSAASTCCGAGLSKGARSARSSRPRPGCACVAVPSLGANLKPPKSRSCCGPSGSMSRRPVEVLRPGITEYPRASRT
jgi:ABC-type Fe3+/spermidine/putrescine transport system ATPase subunit